MVLAESPVMRTVRNAKMLILPMVALSVPLGCARSNRACVHRFQDGTSFRVPSSRAGSVERLSLELLSNSGYENAQSIANIDVWNSYAERDHLYFEFRPPRRTHVRGKAVAFSEMLIPITKDRGPPHILVRMDGRIRAFCKYDCPTSMALQAEIGSWGD